MSDSQSPNVAVVVEIAKAKVTINTLPIPHPGQGEIVIRNYAVAANPVDWKIQNYTFYVETVRVIMSLSIPLLYSSVAFYSFTAKQITTDPLIQYPNVLGSDVAGIVSEIGPNVTNFEVGDHVTGYSGVIYNQILTHGAFQTYTIAAVESPLECPSSMPQQSLWLSRLLLVRFIWT